MFQFRRFTDVRTCKRKVAKEKCGDDAAQWQFYVEKKLTSSKHNTVFNCDQCKTSEMCPLLLQMPRSLELISRNILPLL